MLHKKISGVPLDVADHGSHCLDQSLLVDPEVHSLAFFATQQHPRLAQQSKVMRHGGTTERRHCDDLPDIQALAGFKRQQYALTMFVPERGVDLSNVAPL